MPSVQTILVIAFVALVLLVAVASCTGKKETTDNIPTLEEFQSGAKDQHLSDLRSQVTRFRRRLEKIADGESDNFVIETRNELTAVETKIEALSKIDEPVRFETERGPIATKLVSISVALSAREKDGD